MKELKIDKDFSELMPVLEEEEFSRLEESIKREGCRDSIKVWKGIILDGYNRYSICKKLNMNFSTAEIRCKSRKEARIWIIKNQLGRRNLTNWQKVRLVLMLKPAIEERAKEKQKGHGGTAPGKKKTLNQKSDEVNTLKELSKISGLSTDTIHKAETVLKFYEIDPKSSETIDGKEDVKNSINREYWRMKECEAKQESKEKCRKTREKKNIHKDRIERILLDLENPLMKLNRLLEQLVRAKKEAEEVKGDIIIDFEDYFQKVGKRATSSHLLINWISMQRVPLAFQQLIGRLKELFGEDVFTKAFEEELPELVEGKKYIDCEVVEEGKAN